MWFSEKRIYGFLVSLIQLQFNDRPRLFGLISCSSRGKKNLDAARYTEVEANNENFVWKEPKNFCKRSNFILSTLTWRRRWKVCGGVCFLGSWFFFSVAALFFCHAVSSAWAIDPLPWIGQIAWANCRTWWIFINRTHEIMAREKRKRRCKVKRQFLFEF